MANRFKKMIQPLLDEARKEGYKAGHEQGLKDGFRNKALAYENEIKFLKVLVERLTGRVQPLKTNSDVLRSMSDKELAGFLARKFTDWSIEKKIEKGEILSATQISVEAEIWYQAWMQWLRTPVEDLDGQEQ
jgi:flagellar biosynthesis/type III secretory pathway protein FliH